jgi:hypothetical protein
MGADNPNLGDIALNKVVEMAIDSQIDTADRLDVDLRTNPIDLIQGKMNSIEISGRGLVVKQDLRMETIKINSNAVSIDPLKAVFGNIQLTHPTAAEAQIILTEADINRALNCNYVTEKLQGLKLEMDGAPVTVDVNSATLDLPGENKFVIAATFSIREQNEVKQFSATAVPHIAEDGHRISLEILAAQAQGLTLKLMMAIFEQLTTLLDLRNFNLPGVSLQLYKLEAQPERLVIHAKTQISQIPQFEA